MRAEGFEPPTPSSEDWCSIQLSYARITERRNHNANIDVRQSIQYYFVTYNYLSWRVRDKTFRIACKIDAGRAPQVRWMKNPSNAERKTKSIWHQFWKFYRIGSSVGRAGDS